MVRCNTCHGVYSPTNPDGTQYFHRCPPASRVEIANAIDAGKIPVPPGTNAADFQAAAAAANPPIAQWSLLAADVWLQRRVIERNNLRDENPPSTSARDTGKLTAAGTGTTDIGTPAPTPVTV